MAKNSSRKEGKTMRLIVAIEGLICAGKTSLLRNLKLTVDCLTIPEYGEFIENHEQLPMFPPSNRDQAIFASRFFARLEKRRQKELLLAKKGKSFAVLDRSILSCLAFDFAARNFTGFDTYSEVIQIYQNEKFLQPSLYLYLEIPYQMSINRMKQRGTFSGDHFAGEEFNNLLVGFYQYFFDLPLFFRIDASLNKQEVLRRVYMLEART